MSSKKKRKQDVDFALTKLDVKYKATLSIRDFVQDISTAIEVLHSSYKILKDEEEYTKKQKKEALKDLFIVSQVLSHTNNNLSVNIKKLNQISDTDYVHNRLSVKKNRNTQQSTCSYHKLSPRDTLLNLYNTIKN